MNERDELVARLRKGTQGTDITKTDAFLNCVMVSAADQIERLTKDRDFWKERFQVETRARIRMQDALAAIGAPDRVGMTTMSDPAIRGWALVAVGIAHDVLEDEGE